MAFFTFKNHQVHYEINGEGEWKDYTGPISVKENGTIITGCAFSGEVEVTDKTSVTVTYR